MTQINKLRSVYEFAGFVPRSSVEPCEDDTNALIVPLRRLKKMRSVGSVPNPIPIVMTNVLVWFATSRVQTIKSSFESRCGELIVRSVA
jgi:hypothetical protein